MLLSLSLLSLLTTGFIIDALVNDDDSRSSSDASTEDASNTDTETTEGTADLLDEADEEEDENILGTALDDTLSGTDSDDTIEGRDGDDAISAGDGDDTVFGGNGDDSVAGDDNLQLGDGDDTTLATATSDLGNDQIRGGAGADIITDNSGSNIIYGELGADTITTLDDIGTAESDNVEGGFGNDTLIIDDGDIVSGGDNSDTFNVVFDELDDDAVTITDFNVDEDALVITQSVASALVTDTLTTSNSEDQESTNVYFGDQLIAVLTGTPNVAAEDITFTAFEAAA